MTEHFVADDELYERAKALPRPRRADPVRKERQAENTRRHMEARRRASMALANLHPEEWETLMAAARREVDAEKGPLPGDADD